MAGGADNVETVRAVIRHWVAGDTERAAGLLAPGVVTAAPDGWPEQGPFEGRDAVVDQFLRVQEDWESHSMTVERAEVSGDWVVVDLVWSVTGAASAAPLETMLFGAYRVVDGLIAEMRFFWEREPALAAAGVLGDTSR